MDVLTRLFKRCHRSLRYLKVRIGFNNVQPYILRVEDVELSKGYALIQERFIEAIQFNAQYILHINVRDIGRLPHVVELARLAFRTNVDSIGIFHNCVPPKYPKWFSEIKSRWSQKPTQSQWDKLCSREVGIELVYNRAIAHWLCEESPCLEKAKVTLVLPSSFQELPADDRLWALWDSSDHNYQNHFHRLLSLLRSESAKYGYQSSSKCSIALRQRYLRHDGKIQACPYHTIEGDHISKIQKCTSLCVTLELATPSLREQLQHEWRKT